MGLRQRCELGTRFLILLGQRGRRLGVVTVELVDGLGGFQVDHLLAVQGLQAGDVDLVGGAELGISAGFGQLGLQVQLHLEGDQGALVGRLLAQGGGLGIPVALPGPRQRGGHARLNRFALLGCGDAR